MLCCDCGATWGAVGATRQAKEKQKKIVFHNPYGRPATFRVECASSLVRKKRGGGGDGGGGVKDPTKGRCVSPSFKLAFC
jgi:hypothetical protein